jgi:cytidylate kinase
VTAPFMPATRGVRPAFYEIEARDKRDIERKVSPLKVADEAIILNTDDLTIDQTVNKILSFIT